MAHLEGLDGLYSLDGEDIEDAEDREGREDGEDSEYREGGGGVFTVYCYFHAILLSYHSNMSNRKNYWQRKEVKSSQQVCNQSREGKQADRCNKVDLHRNSQAFRKSQPLNTFSDSIFLSRNSLMRFHMSECLPCQIWKAEGGGCGMSYGPLVWRG